MPILNVTSTSFDHVCVGVDANGVPCGTERQGLAHSEIKQRQSPEGAINLVVECPNGHIECFNMQLDASHEVDERYTDMHRHQAQQIRQLQQHLGLPVK